MEKQCEECIEDETGSGECAKENFVGQIFEMVAFIRTIKHSKNDNYKQETMKERESARGSAGGSEF